VFGVSLKVARLRDGQLARIISAIGVNFFQQFAD